MKLQAALTRSWLFPAPAWTGGLAVLLEGGRASVKTGCFFQPTLDWSGGWAEPTPALLLLHHTQVYPPAALIISLSHKMKETKERCKLTNNTCTTTTAPYPILSLLTLLIINTQNKRQTQIHQTWYLSKDYRPQFWEQEFHAEKCGNRNISQFTTNSVNALNAICLIIHFWVKVVNTFTQVLGQKKLRPN